MTPEDDLNEQIDQVEVQHGEVLGEISSALAAESGGAVDDVMAIPSESLATETAAPAPAPVVASTKTTAFPDTPEGRVHERAAGRRAARKERLAAKHGKVLAEASQVAHSEQRIEDEKPTPFVLDQPETERTTFPTTDTSDHLSESFSSFSIEGKAWRETATGLFKMEAEFIRQELLELDQIRGFLERSRL